MHGTGTCCTCVSRQMSHGRIRRTFTNNICAEWGTEWRLIHSFLELLHREVWSTNIAAGHDLAEEYYKALTEMCHMTRLQLFPRDPHMTMYFHAPPPGYLRGRHVGDRIFFSDPGLTIGGYKVGGKGGHGPVYF